MTTTKNIFQRLQGLEDEIQKLNNTVFALKATDIKAYGENYEELSVHAALRAERIACQLRNLVFLTERPGKSAYMRQAAKAHNLKIEDTEGILSITLPGLLPKRRLHTNTAFLCEPLNFALQDHLKNHSLPLYQSCVICFSQVYDETFPMRRIRDYDNLEFKQVLDVISSYVLSDDTGLLCDTYHTTEIGEHDLTVVYIMDKAVFPDWVKSRKNSIKIISEIL
ncbi:DUF6100 family protein [Clostridium sp. C105KSO13]|uniref:DUF6100 family protein n=1 Tax=Clostridium sp. C105KSO13 TaxID=1776045 RepID=UPI0007405ECD|nr:DUF6100 family protein [Clostridium sp. C105KSO13]CUX16077.1 hypothetical protein BN3456_00140 [Clostridium sp. C105KSO13]